LRVRSDSAAERRKDPGKEVYKAQYFTRLSIADFRILSSLFLRNFKIVGAASGEPGGGDLLVPGEGAGRGDPGQSFGEDFAGGVGIDEGFDAEAGAGFARVGEGAQDDVEAGRSLLDGGFGEARDLEKAAGDGGIARGVKGRGGLGFVSGGGRAGIKVSAGADGDFEVVKGALSFNDAVPAERGAGFGEGGDFVGEFAAVGAGFEGGDGVAVEHDAGCEIED